MRICDVILPGLLLATPLLCQENRNVFEAADVHLAPPMAQRDFMRGPLIRKSRFELRNATMVDMIAYAYQLDNDKVLGGPNWLEYYRYDVIAQSHPTATQDSLREMMKALLSDRFKLVAKQDTQPVPVMALRVAKKALLKPSEGVGETGCKESIGGVTLNENTGPIRIGPDSMFELNCHNVTMASFTNDARGMSNNNNLPVVDQTELKGTWDFSLKYSINFGGPERGGPQITFVDALEKQLGLKLELTKAPMPVIVVQSAIDKPTPNSPTIAEILNGTDMATEFEVAVIKPSAEDFRGNRFQIQPGGRINMQGYTLKQMIVQAWNLNPDMVVDAPKFAEQDRYDVVAKVGGVEPAAGAGRTQALDQFAIWAIFQKLLADRFGLKVHFEERTLQAYTLLAAKPKMKKADPSERMKYAEGTSSPDAKDPRDKTPALSRLVTCTNLTMTQFAAKLQGIAPGYIKSPVLDATGLEGAYDFTLSFSPAGAVGGRGGRGGDMGTAAPAGGGVGAGLPDTADPTGAISLPEAMEKQLGLKLELQKRSVRVLVIDHVEPKPTDN